MSLPGVRTILQDRFFTLTRTDVPEGSRVIGVARRGPETEPYEYTGDQEDLVDEFDSQEEVSLPDDSKTYKFGRSYYSVDTSGAEDEWTFLGKDSETPNYRPFAPRSEQTVIREFGQNSELHRCFLEMVQGGAAQVYLLPVPSDLTDTEIAEELQLDLIFDGVELVRPDVIVLWGRGGHEDANAPVGFHSGMGTSFLRNVARKCRDITDRSNPCFAVMGVKPAAGVDQLSAGQVANHLNDTTVFPDRDPDGIRDGQYISVVGAELRPVAYDDSYGWANGAATYGAFASTLPSEVGATGKRVPDIEELRYGLTRPDQIKVIGKGVVPIAYDSLGRPRVVDALTFAAPPSDYIRLSTLRIVFDAVQMVRNATEPFVGQPSTLHHRNSMETAISSALRNMQVVGALLGSDFVVTYLARENKAKIDLVLIPAFEMRNIEVSVAVQL